MSRVIILGAGASKFAGFPLANNLWDALSSHHSTKNYNQDFSACQPLVETLSQLLENPSKPDLELIFTFADLASISNTKFYNHDLEDAYKTKKAFGRVISTFFKDLSFDTLKKNYTQEILQKWAKCIKEGDTIISFNWDLIHETGLWNAEKWHFSCGYGFKPNNVVELIQSKVTILKLHGSANWGFNNEGDVGPPLIDYSSGFFKGSLLINSSGMSDWGYSLILPSYLKAPAEEPSLIPLWQQAHKALRKAEEIIILGYSLPEADVPSRTLLSTSLTVNKDLKSIKIVAGKSGGFNTAYARWDEFFHKLSLDDRAKKCHHNFEDFVALN